MNQDLPSLAAALRLDSAAVNTQAADLGESITLLLNRTVAIVVAAQEIQRQAIEQSETVQRDWASPVEVAGMKKRIAELEADLEFDGVKALESIVALQKIKEIMNNQVARIAQLESAAAWVPVAMEPPQNWNRYLVKLESRFVTIARWSKVEDTSRWLLDNGNPVYDVIEWRELPQEQEEEDAN
jgi:hypothetical protein